MGRKEGRKLAKAILAAAETKAKQRPTIQGLCHSGASQCKPTTAPNYPRPPALAPLGHNGRRRSPAARPLINPDFNCTLLKALKRLQSGEQGRVNSAD